MKKASTLLAVMAIATSPVFAEPSAPRDSRSATAAPPAVATVIAQPRVMPSGAPACGNVASRAPRRRECAPASAPVLAARPASAAPSAVARPAARPAQATTPRTASALRRGGAR